MINPWLVAIAGGVLSVLLNNDKQLLRKENNNYFRYTYDYCRNNLPHFYFNNNDCSRISSQLERDKYLQSELDYLLQYNDLEDSVQQLINQGKITL